MSKIKNICTFVLPLITKLFYNQWYYYLNKNSNLKYYTKVLIPLNSSCMLYIVNFFLKILTSCKFLLMAY